MKTSLFLAVLNEAKPFWFGKQDHVPVYTLVE